MPYVETDDLRLPFSGVTPTSRHTSAQGAIAATERIGRQALALLTAYRTHGPLTDAEAADVLGVERTTICARRNELVKRRLVEPVDVVKGRRGVNNVRWALYADRP